MAKCLRIIYTVRYPLDRVNNAAHMGVCRYASTRGWDVNVMDWDDALRLPPSISGADCAGIVFECSDSPDDLPRVFPRGSRVVLINCPAPPQRRNCARFRTDNEAVASMAFHELSAGRPAAMATVGTLFGSRHWSDVRERTFRNLAAKAGVRILSFKFSGEGDDSGRLASWVAALPQGTAIFAVNDLMASEVVAAARVALRAIPRELTLIGVDNLPQICEASTPTISSIQIDYERVGYVAARMIGEGAISAPTSVGPLLAVRRRSTGGSGRRETFILEAVEMIRREACDGLTVERLVKRFPCSRRLFEMRFREATGHSALEEIQHVRLEKVCTLLSQTDRAIGAIADMCGYRSGIALKWIFRKRMGVSLTEWRDRNRR